jgi:predicted nucleic acid-binding protein
MRAFLDTSVLVPVFYGDHPHHAASLAIFTKFSKAQASCGAHSLAEVYSTLTRMPGRFRVSGEQVMLFIGSIRERLAVVSLDADEYADTLQSFAALGVAGGAIYDAILAGCALKSKADTLYTWNLRHYGQFGPEITKRLRTP